MLCANSWPLKVQSYAASLGWQPWTWSTQQWTFNRIYIGLFWSCPREWFKVDVLVPSSLIMLDFRPFLHWAVLFIFSPCCPWTYRPLLRRCLHCSSGYQVSEKVHYQIFASQLTLNHSARHSTDCAVKLFSRYSLYEEVHEFKSS